MSTTISSSARCDGEWRSDKGAVASVVSRPNTNDVRGAGDASPDVTDPRRRSEVFVSGDAAAMRWAPGGGSWPPLPLLLLAVGLTMSRRMRT